MFQGRVLCRISLLIIILITISAYTPRDFLGVYGKVRSADSFLSESEQARAEGFIYHKEIKKDKVLYFIKNASVVTRSGTLKNTSFIIQIDSDFIPTYSKLNIEGKIKHFSTATNDGCFDMKSYYNSLGLFFEISDVKVQHYSCGPITKLDAGFRLRKAVSMFYERYLPGEEAGFLASVVVGEKSGLDTELKQLFQNVGIAHILAVSGLHVSVICMAVYKLLRKAGIGFAGSGIICALVAIFYGILTGGSVSSVRAIGMFLIYLFAQIIGESYDMLTAMAVVADFLLFENPLFIKNGSFIFSFGAVLGIFFIVLPLNKEYALWCQDYKRRHKSHDKFYSDRIPFHRRFYQYLVGSLLFSFGMFVSMLPITTQLFYQSPIYSTLLNILVLPLMPVLLGLGVIAGAVGVFYLPFAEFILLPCHVIIYWYEMISYTGNKLPFANVIVGQKSIIFAVIYYVVLCLIVYGFNLICKFTGMKTILKIKGKLLCQVLLMFCVVVLWLIPKKGEFEIDLLDVGQGDGIYICSGDGVRFFIDGGSSSSNKIGQYTMHPFLKYKGAGSIDYWFLSHMDLDHVSGVLELLENGYQIENIVLSQEIPSGETLDNLMSLAEMNKTNIIYMKQGDCLKTKHLSFKCVFPYSGMNSDDVNDLSLCLLMEYDRNTDGTSDYTAFFGGDIASEQEQALAKSGLVENVDLLKVSHHGSRFSSDSTFLETLSPDIAVISCAKRNRYGHPADEAVARLTESGAHIYYTMDSGRIKLSDDSIDEYRKIY